MFEWFEWVNTKTGKGISFSLCQLFFAADANSRRFRLTRAGKVALTIFCILVLGFVSISWEYDSRVSTDSSGNEIEVHFIEVMGWDLPPYQVNEASPDRMNQFPDSQILEIPYLTNQHEEQNANRIRRSRMDTNQQLKASNSRGKQRLP